MDIERVNSVLSKAIVAFQAEEIDLMSEAMAGDYSVPSPGRVMGTEQPQQLGYWNGQDWYYSMEFSGGDTLYFRPTGWLKNGNVKGLKVEVEAGRRGARKAKNTTVNKMDLKKWRPVKRSELAKVVLNRFKDRL